MVVEPAVHHREGAPLAAALIAVMAWGIGPVIVKAITAPTATIVLYRLWMAAPIMFLAQHVLGGRWSWRLVRTMAVPGMLFGLSLAFGFSANRSTSIANSVLIPTLQPALYLIAAGYLGERVNSKQVTAAVIAFAGVVAVVLGAGNTGGATFRGDLYAAINLVLFSVYFVWVKRLRVQGGFHAFSQISMVMLWAAITITPWALVVSTDLGAIGGTDWWLLLLMVCGPGLIGHGLMTWAQRYIPVTLASLLLLGNPVISMIGAWLVHHQGLRPVQVVGGGVVLFGLGVIVLDQRDNSLETAPS